MSRREAASLSPALLAVKGAATPIPLAAERARRRHPSDRSRVTLALDEAQHRRLRLAAAHLRRSRQAILRDALEHYLARVVSETAPRCGCLGDTLERIVSCP